MQRVPCLTIHRQTGQYRAWLMRADGRRGWVYFGTDRDAAEQRYRAELARFLVSDGRAPVRVADLVARVLELARVEHRVGERDSIRYALRFLELPVTVAGQSVELMTLPADLFTVTHLAAVQRSMIAAGKARGYINATMRRIVRAWERARIEGIVSRETIADLRTLPAIQRGAANVHDPGRVLSVDDATVEATLDLIPSATARAIIRLLRIEGHRVGEVCRLQLSMLDDSGPVWRFDLELAHKTGPRTGRGKVLRFRAESQPFLRPFIEQARAAMRSDVYLFPAGRTGSRLPHFRPGSVHDSIEKACKLGGIAPWTTHQLRHARATEVARMKAAAIEAVQAELGHASRSAALGYIDPDVIG